MLLPLALVVVVENRARTRAIGPPTQRVLRSLRRQ